MEMTNMKNDKRKETIKNAIMGLSAFFIYMILSNTQGLPFILLGIDTADLPLLFRIIYLIIYQLLMLGIVAFIFRDRLKRDYEDLKQNHQTYFKKYFKYWFLILILMMASNVLITLVTNSNIAANEEMIRENFQVSPIYVFISAVLIAPFLEELVLRLGFRYMFPSKWLFIILSGFVFGGLHVFTSAQTLVELLYIIPYGIPGLVFAYILDESDNIFVPIGLHFVHNGILMSLQFVLYLFL